MPDSISDKKEREKPTRVDIRYDVEIGDAIEHKELPFVVAVMADLSGQPKEPLEKLKNRRFVEISKDNFDRVLTSMRPRLAFRVDDTLTGKDDAMSVELEFKSMDDFSPEQVAKQVEPLAKLLELRGQLKELHDRAGTKDRLEEELDLILQDAEIRERIAAKLASGADAPKAEEN